MTVHWIIGSFLVFSETKLRLVVITVSSKIGSGTSKQAIPRTEAVLPIPVPEQIIPDLEKKTSPFSFVAGGAASAKHPEVRLQPDRGGGYDRPRERHRLGHAAGVSMDIPRPERARALL